MAGDEVRLPVVTEQAATGETAQLYGEINEFFGLGFVPDVFQLTSTRPSFLRAFWEGFRSIFTEGVLSRETRSSSPPSWHAMPAAGIASTPTCCCST